MRGWHVYMGLFTGALLTFVGLNTWAHVEVGENEGLPCINVAFDDPPAGFEDRIPGPSTLVNGLRTRPFEEMPAKNMYIERGWPLTFQKSSGFLYDLGSGKTWFGVPRDFPSALSAAETRSALAVNLLVAIAPFATLGMFAAAWRWRRRQHNPAADQTH